MRHPERYNVLHSIIQGKLIGKRGAGQRRVSWLRDLGKWLNRTFTFLFRATTNKIVVINMITNVR